jgi:cellulose synthase/poly-beta-1,6-N-acetylglucosamine synthase-like glycosyltransferase
VGAAVHEIALATALSAVGLRWTALLIAAVLGAAAERRRGPPPASSPSVALIIPAFREEVVVEATLRRALATDYPDLRVVLVDDGSPDRTSEIARRVAETDPRVTVLTLERNGGKANALNAALDVVDSEIVVTVDADTWVEPDLVRRLVDALVGRGADAAASNVKVGNAVNLWTRWQSLEYVAGLQIDRRAQDWLGVITTVPGAASAWRRDVVRAHGGFSDRTLAEDTDLTLTLLRAGRRVVFAPDAVARTEAPTDPRGLFRQRLRWMRGNLACTWIHTAALWSPAPARVRWLAVPNLWFTHVLVYLLLPLTLGYAAWYGGPRTGSWLGALFLALFALDLSAALFAYSLDRERTSDLWWAPSQRVGYPLFLWAVFATVIVRVARGVPQVWGTLARRGLG